MEIIGLLPDSELQGLERQQIIGGLPNRTGTVENSPEDPIQPASLDLHVGEIYVPGSKNGERGSAGNPIKDWHEINPGETAVVVVAEYLDLPNNLAGIGFAATGLARAGLLTPSIGHVDPGYKGSLVVVLINMGQRPYFLMRGAHVGTLILFRLAQKANVDYGKRHANSATSPRVTQGMLDRLSKDFGNFQENVRKQLREEMKAEVNKASMEILTRLLGAALLIPAIFLTATALTKFLVESWGDVHALEQRIGRLEWRLDQVPQGPPARPAK